jgi:hypothetical protein
MKISENIYSKIYFKIFLQICIITKALAIDINLIKGDVAIPVITNSTLNEFFSYNENLKSNFYSSCKEKLVYYEFENSNTTVFTANETIDNIQIDTGENILINSNHQDNQITLTHSCTEDSEENWGVVNATVYYSFNKTVSFQFIKFCDNPNMGYTLMTICLIFTTATLIVIISTYSELKIEFTEISEEGEIKNWHIFIFILFGSGVLVLIFLFKEYINTILTLIVLFQSTLALYLTTKNILEFVSEKFVILKDKVDIKCIRGVEVLSLVVYFSTGLIMLGYVLTKYWVLNNILGFSLVFTILSLFHIKNLKICAILLTAAFCYDVFWVYISPLIFTGNVMVIAATSMDLPIKFEFPIIMFNHPLKTCMFLGLGDIVLPGFVVKFCRRYDFIKNTNVYYKFSIVLYTLALIFAGLGITVFNYPQPVMFYMCPVLLIGLGCLARKRKENDIWNADILEEQIIEHMSLPETCTDIENSVCSSDSTE